ncbi:hypothetical protein Acid345_2851 [Candidatus Koribacter versatilis Ellin345]|uniref:Glycosyltransferase RgtA/B/C/D-like domain-containing protein n=1 Tax=Koribacter versatilis (strain Ellin345) TaxID=204669 RepID=Q1IMP8_KORVE|nr:hypothetical protein [Candidatus Koribacter versatilis]ABF41852.1 hypothetical protein Acid345_2851 [Candidatus Koribacter versatilis Ellin345]
MHIGQFTVRDLLGCSAAIVAFAPFLLAPGFCVGHFCNIFGFRTARWPERIAASLALSFAITPISATLIARFSSLSTALAICLASFALAAVIIARELQHTGLTPPSRSTKVALWLCGIWIVLVLVSVVDVQLGTRIYPTAATFDLSLRTAVTDAALRTGVPPANPMFFPGHAIAMRYYYYWYVVCALPAKLCGFSPRIATLASIAWGGFGIAALIPLYLKHFCGERSQVGRKSVIGIALLAVTGLDLIPTLRIFLSEHTILPDMEWWDWAQVTSWFDSMIWVPHHIAALVALLAGFLVLWDVPEDAPRSQRVKAAIIAGLAFASAAGLSVYVTFTVGLFLIIWAIILLRSHLLGEFLMFLGTGLVTVIVSLGYLHDLRQPGLGVGFAAFYVRALASIQQWGDAHIHSLWLENLFLAAMLPVYYFLELGFFALVAIAKGWKMFRRERPLEKWEWACVTMLGSSALVGSFMMSTTGNNDLGYRALLLGQFVLILWAVPIVFRWTAAGGSYRTRWTLLAQTFLAFGVLGTAYQLTVLRTFIYLNDQTSYTDEAPWLPEPDAIGWQLYYIRSGFEKLNSRLPKDAIVQYNPVNPAYVPSLLYSWHQTVAGVGACGTGFGGDPFECLPYQSKIVALFGSRTSVKFDDADAVCKDLKIDVLIAQRTDRMWALRKSWVWTERPVVSTPVFRAFACGNRREEIERRFAAER